MSTENEAKENCNEISMFKASLCLALRSSNNQQDVEMAHWAVVCSQLARYTTQNILLFETNYIILYYNSL